MDYSALNSSRQDLFFFLLREKLVFLMTEVNYLAKSCQQRLNIDHVQEPVIHLSGIML